MARDDSLTLEGTGGEILVRCLKTHGVDTLYCVPGESYLAVLDALYDAPQIRPVVCRQEGGAAMMADAYGKLTGRPGICFVTRGPGATNASAGVHVAFQDSTPMILFVGQVAREDQEREAFQEIDYRRMYGQMAKWVAEIDDARRIPEFLSRAFHTATAGRPGPVVLALPEDMLRDRVAAPACHAYEVTESAMGLGQVERLGTLLETAERPFCLIGGAGWDATACERFRRFAEAWKLPVGTAFRRQDHFDNLHGCYAGDVGIGANPKLARRVREADLLLVVGPRLGEMTTGGYSLLGIPEPHGRLVHVHPDPEELGRVYRPTLAVAADPRSFSAAVLSLVPPPEPAWAAETEQAHRDYLDWNQPVETVGPLQMASLVDWLARTLPSDSIVCNGAGNYATWVHRFYRYRRFGTQLAPTSGSMGYGVPAAVAAKLRHPERTVVAFAGDGCFLMTGQEVATAVQHEAAVIFIVVDNGMYGTIRMHQERNYPGRTSATDLKNPDFAKLAEAYGGHGERVERSEDFAPAFERARAAGKPALLHLILDPEAISPLKSLSQIRAEAEAKAK